MPTKTPDASSFSHKRLFTSVQPPLKVQRENEILILVAQSKGLQIELTKKPKPRVALEELVFGHTFTDHMLLCEWTKEGGWARPLIKPFGDLQLPPSASCLHYATECFEGLKAYKDSQGSIRLFRPDLNMNRLIQSARRLALPDFEEGELLALISTLLKVDSDWIPDKPGYSLYIRPTIIGTGASLGVSPSNRALLFVICSPVGPYYRTGFSAVSLYAEDRFVRAWPGGTGSYKIGANYAGGILPQTQVAPSGYQQVLWIFGDEHYITEVGTMNCFIFWINEKGQKELVTAPLTDGTILPGVTRDSILSLARTWGEFEVSERPVTMKELILAINDNRLLEMFGSGTAAVVSPIKRIKYLGQDWNIPLDPSDPSSQAGPLAKRFWEAITLIQYGQVPHEWSVIVE